MTPVDDSSDNSWGVQHAVEEAAEKVEYDSDNPDLFYEKVVESKEVKPYFDLEGEQIIDLYESDLESYENVGSEHLEVMAELSDMGESVNVRFLLEDGTGRHDVPYIEFYEEDIDIEEVTDVSRI